MWPAKNQSRRLPMPDYVISDNPCQARLPTASSRGRTARLSPHPLHPVHPGDYMWMPWDAKEETKSTRRKTVEDVTVMVTSQGPEAGTVTGARGCWWRRKTRATPQCKASIWVGVRWNEQNWTGFDCFLNLSVCSSLIPAPGFLIVQTRSPHGVVLISDPRLHDFIINSVFNLQSKEKLFL